MFERLNLQSDRSRAFTLAAAAALAVAWVNILSKMQEALGRGAHLDWRIPMIEEVTSVAVILALFAIPWRLAKLRVSDKLSWP